MEDLFKNNNDDFWSREELEILNKNIKNKLFFFLKNMYNKIRWYYVREIRTFSWKRKYRKNSK